MSSNIEMAIEPSAALISVDDDDLESRSISELVSFLRTAFRAKDFNKVEEVLVAKEVKMRKEIESKKKEYEILQSNYEFLRLDNLTHESNHTKTPESKVEQDKVEVKPKGFEKWKETYESLKEKENENQQLKELIVKVNEDREKKKSALEGFEKMLEVVKKTQEDDRLTIEKLKHKNSELQSAIEVLKKEKEDYEKTIEELNFKKSDLESQIVVVKNSEEDDRKYIEDLKCKNSELECTRIQNYELCRRKYEELARRVSQLENENDSCFGDKFENQTGTGGAIVEIISDDDHVPAETLSQACRNQKRKRGSLLNDCEDYDVERDDDVSILASVRKGKESLKKVGAMFSTPPDGRADKHALKMHSSHGTNDCNNIMTSSRAAAVVLRQCAEEVGRDCRSLDSKFKYASFRMDYVKDDYFISLDSDSDIQNRYGSSHLKSKDQGKRRSKKWELEAEMSAAFAENDMLCMEAVCILYRQSSLFGQPYNAPSRYRGFNEADLLRGSTLALFLTNRDPKGKLRKSVTELEKFDISGLIDCRRIAIQHLKQLFEIYKNNDDQFMFH